MDEGISINWKDFMAINMSKATPEKVYIKISYFDFYPVTLTSKIRSTHTQRSVSKLSAPEKACGNQKGITRLSRNKDLIKLMKGTRPLILHPDHVSSYTNLPHDTQ